MSATMISTRKVDNPESLDMGWAHEELIPFLETVFVGFDGMSTAAWERLVLFARFNLDKIVSTPQSFQMATTYFRSASCSAKTLCRS